MPPRPGSAEWERERGDYWFHAYEQAVKARYAARQDARIWRDRFFRAMRLVKRG